MTYTTTDTITVSVMDLTDTNVTMTDPWYADPGTCSPTWTPNITTTVPMPNVYVSNSGTSDFSSIGSISPHRNSSLSLHGEDADITINGESLMTMIRGIQDRLNILAPDPAMEQEWSELAELRQAYETKLQECREKSRMWQILKK